MKCGQKWNYYEKDYSDAAYITNCREGSGYQVVNLSDGTHWFCDNASNARTARSLIDAEITFNDNIGWLANGSEIEWVD